MDKPSQPLLPSFPISGSPSSSLASSGAPAQNPALQQCAAPDPRVLPGESKRPMEPQAGSLERQIATVGDHKQSQACHPFPSDILPILAAYSEDPLGVLDELLSGAQLQTIAELAPEKREELLIGLVRQHGAHFFKLPEGFRGYRVSLAAIEEEGRLLQFMPQWQGDSKFCEPAVRQSGLALEWVQDKTKAMCVAAVKQTPEAFRHVPEELQTDRDLWLTMVSRTGSHLQNAPDVVKEDPMVCLAAVTQFPSAFAWVKAKDNFEVCMAAVTGGYPLHLIPPRFKNDARICLAAVRSGAARLAEIPTDLPNYDAVCMEAVKRDTQELLWVPKDLHNYGAICLAAVRKNAKAIELVSQDAPNYDQLCLAAVNNDPSVITLIPEKHRTLEVWRTVAERDPALCRSAPQEIRDQLGLPPIQAVTLDLAMLKLRSLEAARRSRAP